MIFRPISQRLVVAPAQEPLPLAFLKNQMRVEQDLDDALITLLGKAARFQAEKITGDKFITQTWELIYPGFPHGNVYPSGVGPIAGYGWSGGYADGLMWSFEAKKRSIPLTIRPIQSAVINYIDVNGNTQTFGTFVGSPATILEWGILPDNKQPRLILNYDQTNQGLFHWPQTAPVWNAVTILVTAGYGDDATNLPELYQMGLMMLAAHFNENREAVVADESRVTAIEIPLGIRDLLAVPKVG